MIVVTADMENVKPGGELWAFGVSGDGTVMMKRVTVRSPYGVPNTIMTTDSEVLPYENLALTRNLAIDALIRMRDALDNWLETN